MALLAPERQADSRAAGLAAVRTFAVAALAGAVSGFLAGGIVGRLAMRLLALTSPEIAQGRLTDDAARVGQVTLGGSVGLGLALAVVGAILGIEYVPLRRALLEGTAAPRVGAPRS